MTKTQTRVTFDLDHSRDGREWRTYYPTNARAPGRPPYQTLPEAHAALEWVLTEGHPGNRRLRWRIVQRETTTTIIESVEHEWTSAALAQATGEDR